MNLCCFCGKHKLQIYIANIMLKEAKHKNIDTQTHSDNYEAGVQCYIKWLNTK